MSPTPTHTPLVASLLLLAAVFQLIPTVVLASYYGEGPYGSSAYAVTQVVLDTTPPVISSISSGMPAAASTTISWLTDESATTAVYFGTSTAYGSMASTSGFVTSHVQALTGLSASTEYHYIVLSEDSRGNLATSSDQSFTTAAPAPPTDTTAPVVTNATGSTFTATTTSVMLTLTTDESASCRYATSTGASFVTMTAFQSTGSTSHSSSIAVTPGSYTYYAKCQDAAANTSSDTAIAFIVAQPAQDLSQGLVLRYSFDAASISSSTLADDSGNNHPGTISAASTTAGRIGDALQFSGTSYVDVGTTTLGLADTYTLSLWVKQSADNPGATYDTILTRGQSIYPLAVQMYSNRRVRAGNRTSGTSYLSSIGSPPAATWMHVAITYAQGSRKIYVNGVLNASDVLTGNLSWVAGQKLFIGRSTPTVTDGFIGSLDDLRIYNRVLTQQELTALAGGS